MKINHGVLHWWTRTVFAVLVGIGAFGIYTRAQSPPGSKIAAELDAGLKELFEMNLAPGMAVAVVQGEEAVYERGFGYADLEKRRPVTPDTVFYIASTTKSFTAFAAALLHFRGVLDLDAPVSRYLPKLQLKPPLSADSITMRNLLTHTHGILPGGPVEIRTAFSGDYTNGGLVELLADYQPSPSGRTYQYSNLSYIVAGLVMDDVLGTSWKEVVGREIFLPLGMKDTTAYRSKVDSAKLALPYRAEPQGMTRVVLEKSDGNMHAAGGLLTSVRDLEKYLEAHMNDGRVDGRQVFPVDAIRETQKPQAKQRGSILGFQWDSAGLGWDLGTYGKHAVVQRFGSFPGFASHLGFMPEKRIGVAVLVNESTLGNLMAHAAATLIYERLSGNPDSDKTIKTGMAEVRKTADSTKAAIRRDRETRAARPQALPHPLDAYVGTFESPRAGKMVWRKVDGRLRVSLGLAESDVEVYDGKNNQFRVELTDTGSVVTFNFQGEQLTGLSWIGFDFALKQP